MTYVRLNALWPESPAPGARRHIIFRTAAEPRLLPGHVRPPCSASGTIDAGRLAQLISARDRSAIYDGFHLLSSAADMSDRRAGGMRPDEQSLSESAPLLRCDPEMLSAGPRPADRRASDAGQATPCSRSAAAPDEIYRCGPPRYSEARFFGIDVSPGMLGPPRRPRSADQLWRGAMRWPSATHGFDRRSLFGRRGFERVLISYCLSMIPRVAPHGGRRPRRARAPRRNCASSISASRTSARLDSLRLGMSWPGFRVKPHRFTT